MDRSGRRRSPDYADRQGRAKIGFLRPFYMQKGRPLARQEDRIGGSFQYGLTITLS